MSPRSRQYTPETLLRLHTSMDRALLRSRRAAPGVPVAFRTLPGDPRVDRRYEWQEDEGDDKVAQTEGVYTWDGDDLQATWAWKGHTPMYGKGKYEPSMVTIATRKGRSGSAQIREVKDLTVIVLYRKNGTLDIAGHFTPKGSTKPRVESFDQVAVIRSTMSRDKWTTGAFPTMVSGEDIEKYGFAHAFTNTVSRWMGYGEFYEPYDFTRLTPNPNLNGFLLGARRNRKGPAYPDGRIVPLEGDAVIRSFPDQSRYGYENKRWHTIKGTVRRSAAGPLVVTMNESQSYGLRGVTVLLDRYWTREWAGIPASQRAEDDRHNEGPGAWRAPPTLTGGVSRVAPEKIEGKKYGEAVSQEAYHLRSSQTGSWLPIIGDTVARLYKGRLLTGTVVAQQDSYRRDEQRVRLDSTRGLAPKEAEALEELNFYTREETSTGSDDPWRVVGDDAPFLPPFIPQGGPERLPAKRAPYLYHGTSSVYIPTIEREGLPSGTFWGTQRIADYYAEETVEQDGGTPVIFRVPLSAFNPTLLLPDRNSVAEPLTFVLQTTDAKVYQAWKRAEGTWQDSLRIVESVIYQSMVSPKQIHRVEL